MEIPEKKEKEKPGALRCCKEAKKHGWKCHRLNVSAGRFSTVGFPDYYFTHKIHGVRWVEFKRDDGKLEQSQVDRFNEFLEHGIGVWILVDEIDYPLLFKAANFWKYVWQGRVK